MYDPVDKKGIPGSIKIGPGIFFAPGPLMNNFQGEKEMKQEQVQLKMTLLLIKDWDGFQMAMRGMMLPAVRRIK